MTLDQRIALAQRHVDRGRLIRAPTSACCPGRDTSFNRPSKTVRADPAHVRDGPCRPTQEESSLRTSIGTFCLRTHWSRWRKLILRGTCNKRRIAWMKPRGPQTKSTNRLG